MFSVYLVFSLLLAGQSQSAPKLEAVEKARRHRLMHMTSVVDSVQIETTGEMPRKLRRSEQPVLRYTNPVTFAHGDGGTFLWLDGTRPAAAVSLSFRKDDMVYWELTSLSDEPLKASRDGTAVWLPKSAGKTSATFPNAPAPAETAARRLTQMRALSRQFEVREFRREQWQDGRLLSQPLYRWEAPERGLIDGALFAYAETTDPEILLLIEARRDSNLNTSQWYYTLAKMTSAEVKVSLDGNLIWNVPGYWKNPRGPEDSYVEAIVGVYTPPLE